MRKKKFPSVHTLIFLMIFSVISSLFFGLIIYKKFRLLRLYAQIEEELNDISYPENMNATFEWCPPNFSLPSDYVFPDCNTLISGQNKSSADSSKNWASPCTFTDEEMMIYTSKCSSFKKSFPFWSDVLRSSEKRSSSNYPLAFVVVAEKNAEQVVRLFQTVYHPNNIYCLTYDKHSSNEFQQTLRNIASCYSNNIFMPDEFIEIYWAGYSILKSIMFCLKKLNQHPKFDWRYVQILSWNDFPLKTNREMIRIMKILNGSQDGELTNMDASRYRIYHVEGSVDETKKNYKKPRPPGHLVIYKGSTAVVMSREFVQFLFTNQVAKDFFKWCETSWAPEEQYLSTMIHNTHLNPPGGFPGQCLNGYQKDNFDKPYVSRYHTWYGHDCKGKLVSSSCVFGVGDLLRLTSAYQLVAHKIYLDFQPATYYCLAEWHFNKSFNLAQDSSLNVSFYETMPSVIYHNMKDKQSFVC